MFKPLIAALAAAPLFAGSAFAGPYVNVEANASYPDGEYTTATTDIHFGFDGATEDGKVAYYVQGGPAFQHTESTDDTEQNFQVRLVFLLPLLTVLTSMEKSLESLTKILVEIPSSISVVSLVLSTPSDSISKLT